VDVQVADLAPREIDVSLDSAARKEVRIVARVTLNADSTFVLQGIAVHPATARLIGPPKSLTGIDSVMTVPVTISDVTGPFTRSVSLETSSLGAARVVPGDVQISGDVMAVRQRGFPSLIVTTAASGFSGFALAKERVAVIAYGPASRVEALTRDSLRVVAHLVGHGGPDAYARLTVVSPAGITAHAVPDSVGLKAVKPLAPPKPPSRPAVKRRGSRG
jgi:hypothetical protein